VDVVDVVVADFVEVEVVEVVVEVVTEVVVELAVVEVVVLVAWLQPMTVTTSIMRRTRINSFFIFSSFYIEQYFFDIFSKFLNLME
jgi:hypothetical protein